ncbi:PREDICTED: uncharacterized protein LOC108556984 [Nicrophorus vespilloides]|uniref:Uncharacterized protein LOC108556984 n=1 Tax=Nicrophorus vespilloides TaxID=110193 RepID=A0ABM1M2N4_NICVS|nr:PREDICTED: uncharacterized protein LOC108556984 [Nicrophorus vespilloides]
MKWISAIILLAIMGVTKAHHIKLILLTLLGLAGLYWMQNNRPSGPKQLFDIATKLLTKRDIHQQTSDIDWELVITNDPSTCARSYVCQLAATRADDSMLDRIKLVNSKMVEPIFNQRFSGTRKERIGL